MTVKDLKEFLSKYPDDMEITETRYSDMKWMSLDSWRTLYLRNYGNNEKILAKKNLLDYDPSKIKTYIHYAGN